MIRVVLPAHLCQLAQLKHEIDLQVNGLITLRSILDALELQYPALRGTIRDPATAQRRAYIRFFACGMDLSLHPLDDPVPDLVVSGEERFMVVGAMAGG
jgi:hypothetical protein